MRLFNIVIVACVVLAAAQAIASAVAPLIVLGVMYGLFSHPGPTLSALALLAAASAFEAQPAPFIIVVGLLVGIPALAKCARTRR
jgi:hypothetical protein